MPREQRAVARYTAPAPLRPSRPTALAVRRAAGSTPAITITWRAGARTARSAITVVTTDGRRLLFTARAGRLTVPGLSPRLVREVRVVGLRADGATGPAAVTRAVVGGTR
ncbi:MAG: hypothetical protein PGN13_15390 [Patulibacter minatonensis]